MRFTFAYGLMSKDLGRLNTDRINAPDADKAKAVLARDLSRERIAKTLWPVFDRAHATTQPPHHVEALVKADFEILRQLRAEEERWDKPDRRAWVLAFYCDDSMFQKIGTPLIDGENIVMYRTGYAASFDRFARTSFGEDAQDYLDRAFSGDESAIPAMQLRDWIVLSLKHQFQRPRPYQYAFDNGDETFKHKVSQVAHSPSLPSGHAYDAAFAAIGVVDRIDSVSQWVTYRDRFPAWAANYGDLRNYAGLHYPSDNWATWIAVATIIDKTFSGSEADVAKGRLRANILASRCFQLAESHAEFDLAKQQLVELLGSFE